MSKVKRPIKLATTDPGVGDDVADGYSVGWQWFNITDEKFFICKSAAAGAADWVEIAGGGGGGGAVDSVNTRDGDVVLVGTDIPTFVASGGSHAPGAVPDPPSTAGTAKFLCENATWDFPAGGVFQLLEWGTLNVGTPPGASTGHFTLGCAFNLTKIISVVGARFYWPSATNRTVRLELWDGGSAVKSVDVTTSGIGIYSGTFSTPYTPSSGDLYKELKVSMWDTINGASMIYADMTDADAGTRKGVIVNVPMAPGYIIRSYSMFIANHADPTSASGTARYLVEPVFG